MRLSLNMVVLILTELKKITKRTSQFFSGIRHIYMYWKDIKVWKGKGQADIMDAEIPSHYGVGIVIKKSIKFTMEGWVTFSINSVL